MPARSRGEGAGPGASVAEIEALYRARAGAFVRFATAMLGDRELACEVVQDAFAKALRGRSGFRGDGSLEAWMWSAVANTARNAGRRRSLRMRLAARRCEQGEEEPVDRAELDRGAAAAEASALRGLVAALPERQRMCVFLFYFADLDYASIADALGVRPGTVAATLNAARASLRGYLEQERGR